MVVAVALRVDAAPVAADRRITSSGTLVVVFVDLVADDAADSGAADGPGCAAVGNDGAAHRAYAGADGRIFVTLRHAAATG